MKLLTLDKLELLLFCKKRDIFGLQILFILHFEFTVATNI